MRPMQSFIVTIEGPGWTETDEVELLGLPDDGEPIETKVGTCVVTHTEPLPSSERHDGRIVCRLP
jgi:hypothetical protein